MRPSTSRHNSEPKGYFTRPHKEHSPSRSHRDHSPSSRHRGHSPARSVTSSVGRGVLGSILGGGGGGRHNSSSSYYKRRPRDGYISKLVHQIKRLFSGLMRYAKRNPIKLFMLVIMPLVTGGALHKILKTMGVRLPAGMEKMMGGSRGGGGYGGQGGHEGGRSGGGGGSGVDIGQLMGIAKMFM